MSKRGIIPLDQNGPSTGVTTGLLSIRRWPLFSALAVLAVLALAYFDGGEEPIHPISQEIALPIVSGSNDAGATE